MDPITLLYQKYDGSDEKDKKDVPQHDFFFNRIFLKIKQSVDVNFKF